MKNILKILTLALAIFLFSCLTAQAQTSDLTALNIIQAVNSLRLANNLQPLIISEELTLAATNKALDMQAKQYFSHFDGQNNGLEKWLKTANYNYYHAGENLALDFYKLSLLIDNWEQSPKHLQNLLDPLFQETGVAVIRGEFKNQPTIFVVQMFGADPYKIHQTYFPSLIPTRQETGRSAIWLPSLIGKDDVDILLSTNETKHYYLWDLPYRLKLSTQATDNNKIYQLTKTPTPALAYQKPSVIKNTIYFFQDKLLYIWLIILALIALISSQKIKEEK